MNTNNNGQVSAQIDTKQVLGAEPNRNPKAQIEHWLMEFTKLANDSKDGNRTLAEYWKGQVFGISKMVGLLNIDVDADYWLRQLP